MKIIRSYNRRTILITGFLLIFIHYLIFSYFFPNSQGKLGHDYSFFFPALLDGFFWYNSNGLFSIPWFTPSFCGGVPLFPHPASPYFFVPQFLTFVMNPLASIKLTFIIFGALGFWGFYFFSRRIISASISISFLAATLFLFNGFFSYRIIIGHLEFHSIMLVPWCAYLIMSPSPNLKPSPWQIWFNTIMAGVIITYVFLSGMGQLLFALLLSIILICLMSVTFYPNILSLKSLFLRFFSAGCIAIGLSISKLIATLSFLSHFPRSDYQLPGFPDISDLLMVLGKSLFLWPAHELAKKVIVNMQWLLDRHEFEFGITIIPLFLICIGLIYQIYRIVTRKAWELPGIRKALLIFICLFICIIPIALNYYSPAWNQFLKSIPILKSSGQFVRWFILYIPSMILLTTIIVESTPLLMKNQFLLSIIGIFAIVIINVFPDRSFYHEQSYNPSEILQAYQKVRKHEWTPRITNISICVDKSGNILFNQNNSLTKGYSQLFCYDPIFGYRLENFPKKGLEPGRILKENDGYLNLKNPACYIFPNENNCMPGDHFTIDQKEEASHKTKNRK
ncbi:MAG: hypothetical protein JRJ02_09175 [Deltaproteobacteria bacterium]|nr:hypothetical protein [Deltaproteobacteria bacterium]